MPGWEFKEVCCSILPAEDPMSQNLKYLQLGIIIVCLIFSGLEPFDRTTWVLEVFPVLIGVPLLLWLDNKHKVTMLLFSLIILHCLVLMYGGAYSYARAPLGFWLQDIFHFSRNPYDRIGHFMQGFVPAILAREVLVRSARIQSRRYLFFLCVSVCLAFSAFYELIEWTAALILGQGADEFLGTQGDQWDTQWDMFMALVGALSALILLSRVHDKQIHNLTKTN
jgi:putative membrane protein